MRIRLYTKATSERDLERVAETLRGGGVVIYPTDSVYAFGCSLRSPRAIEALRRIKGKDAGGMSLMFDTIARASEYVRIDNAVFRTLKRNLPGPFTFILPASSRVPDKALERRKNIGVRIADNAIARAIVERLDCPLVTTSVHDDDSVVEYTTDPELIEERWGAIVDMVVDGGCGDNRPTTLVDMTGDEPEVLREGLGVLR